MSCPETQAMTRGRQPVGKVRGGRSEATAMRVSEDHCNPIGFPRSRIPRIWGGFSGELRGGGCGGGKGVSDRVWGWLRKRSGQKP